ncbi:MAG: TonB-dependent receptor [Acidobacteriota bacterium]
MRIEKNSPTLELGLGWTAPHNAVTGSLTGRITDSRNRPVRGAAIELACSSLPEAHYAETGADGLFHFAAVPAEECALSVLAPGFARHRSRHRIALEGTDVTLELRPSRATRASSRVGSSFAVALATFLALPASAENGALSGRVTDPEGQPVGGASVELSCPSLADKQRATTGADGAFRLSSAPAEACQLSIAADGFARYRSAQRIESAGREVAVRLRLETVRGEILVTSSIPELATERRLSGDEIVRSGVEDLGESFRGVEGLSAVRRGPLNLEPVIRGLQEEQVGTFVDGTRTFAAGPARMDSNISHVGTHATQSVQVIKGPYALTWGAGTLSALEIETIAPDFTGADFDWGGSLGYLYGDNAGSADAHGGFWGSNDSFRFYLGGGYREGDDYEDGNGVEVPGDYESTETRWRLGYRPSENLLLEYSGGYQEQFDIDYPGRLLDATYFYARSAALELTWNGEGRVSEVYGQVYANRKDHLMNNDEKPTARDAPGRIPPFAIDVALPTESNTQGGRFKIDLDRGETSWSFGADYYRVEQTASRTIARRSNGFVLFRDVVWPDAEIEDLGGWAQVVWGGDNYRVGATLRLDEVDASADNLSPFYVANTVGSPNQSESHVSAAISATYDLDEAWALTVGVGRAVRTATALERYSDRFPATKFQLAAEFMGNPELDAEESLELDVGLRGRLGDVLVEVETFYRQIDDYITVTPDPSLPKRLPLSPPVVFRYVNGSEATFYGGELLLRQRINNHFSWRGSLAYVRAEDEALDEPVLGIAPLNGEAGVRFHTLERRLWVDFGIRFADRQDRVATTRFEQETPGWAIYNLSAGYELAGGWSLSAAVENLTDHAYADHLNSPNPFNRTRVAEIGRNVRVGVAFGF